MKNDFLATWYACLGLEGLVLSSLPNIPKIGVPIALMMLLYGTRASAAQLAPCFGFVETRKRKKRHKNPRQTIINGFEHGSLRMLIMFWPTCTFFQSGSNILTYLIGKVVHNRSIGATEVLEIFKKACDMRRFEQVGLGSASKAFFACLPCCAGLSMLVFKA